MELKKFSRQSNFNLKKNNWLQYFQTFIQHAQERKTAVKKDNLCHNKPLNNHEI